MAETTIISPRLTLIDDCEAAAPGSWVSNETLNDSTDVFVQGTNAYSSIVRNQTSYFYYPVSSHSIRNLLIYGWL